MVRTLLILTGIILIILPPTLTSAVPSLVSDQGRLTTAAGDPVQDGTYFIRFQIYDAPTGGTSLWNSNIQPVVVTGGVYTYLLGQDVPLPDGLFSGGNRWLGITVGADPELTPRKQFLATAFAFTSQNADSIGWAGIKNMPAGFADGIDNIGTGDITAVNTSDGLTGGVTSGDANLAIAASGVTSAHIANGTITDADLADTAKVIPAKIAGTAATLAGSQVFTGFNTFSDQIAIERIQPSSPESPSLRASHSNNSAGPVETAEFITINSGSGSAYGLSAEGRSNGGYRFGSVFRGRAITQNLTTGDSYGVYSTATDGAFSVGVYGSGGNAIEARGLYGGSHGTSYQGVGAHGIAGNNNNIGIGVSGQAHGNPYGYGVIGEVWNNSIEQFAGSFFGNVNVTGTIFMPSLISRVDHPADPEGKYLQHASVQAPDMINVYSGNIVTDGTGEATVTLPDYFTLINADFRYQLTVIGQFAQAIVSQEIQDNKFTIKTDKPSVKVSWQVVGTRQDSFARANRIVVEQAKMPHELGKYAHPELYGLGLERSIGAEIRLSARRMAGEEKAKRETEQVIESQSKR